MPGPATATQLGLVPGFALQNGDLLAELLTGGAPGAGVGGGGFGLGNTVSNPFALTSGSAAAPTPIVSSVTVITSANAANAFLQLVDIPVCTILRIYNNTVQLISIAPPDPSQAIDGVPGVSVGLGDGARCDYLFIGNGQWLSDLLGSVSQ